MTVIFQLSKGTILLALSAAILLSACNRSDPQALMVSARAYQSKGDYQAAIIQLKNLLQQQPQNGEARLLLGQSALIVGDAPTAEKEFRKALEQGQAASSVVPLIAESMFQGGNAEKLVFEFSTTVLEVPQANAELRALVGEAQLELRDLRAASDSFAAALAIDPRSVRARLGLARLQARDGRVGEAIKSVEAIVAAHPDSVDGFLLLGELKFALGDRPAARAALKRAIDAVPARTGPRLHLISLLIGDGQYDAAAAEVAAARAVRAPELALQYFEAQIAWASKDLVKARELAEQLIKKAPGHVPASVLLGAIEFQDGNFANAETHLRYAIARSPKHVVARALLARTYLVSRQPAQALEVLRPVIGSGSLSDPRMLLLVGEAYFANGDLTQAARYFESATVSKAQQPLAQTRLAQIAMAGGDLEGGLRRLEGLMANEAAPLQAEMVLLTAYLRQGDSRKALEVARAMVKKQPNDPVAHQALGSVMLNRRQFAAARNAFSEALRLNPTYVPAAAALATFDLSQNKPKQARERFESVLAKGPKNEAALIGLAGVLVQTKAPAAEIIGVLQRAVEADTRSVNARLALIEFQLHNRDARAALAAAQEASAAVGENSRILDALGRAQLVAGDANQAIDTFNRLAVLEPQSPMPLMRLALAYASQKQDEKAAEALVRARKIAPADANVTRELVADYLRLGKNDDALNQAKALQAAAPNAAEGFLLEGDVHGASQRFPMAERAYREALKVNPTSELAAQKLYTTLLASNKKAEAIEFGNKWLADHPSVPFRIFLAEHALRAHDLKVAVAHYEVIVRQRPKSTIALNNLAWALGQLGDPRALEYAERAAKLGPNDPAVLDTYGVLLSSKGHSAKGLEYLSRAVELAPDRHEVRLNYAKALLTAGRKEEARKQLVQLASVEQDFPGKSEVAALLKQ